LSEETVADRFRFWDEAQNLAVERWKAGHVLAWLEFGLGMGRFLSACANNIKSGKVYCINCYVVTSLYQRVLKIVLIFD